jgi:hypothetical protein
MKNVKFKSLKLKSLGSLHFTNMFVVRSLLGPKAQIAYMIGTMVYESYVVKQRRKAAKLDRENRMYKEQREMN